ncbi:uncharacterized protein LOC133796347 isoform X2 [Humulus lupulus]|uniref:uncharacterized protein LOC133796347 isoform X2 n=1 Tax=Humulus lupulus TaxID=3486 RepID=UPI002B401E7D|nr:uncharacterized protein LOC133796347 isoform X2 [Humulus lupulus]
MKILVVGSLVWHAVLLGKRKVRGTVLLALGSDNGDVFAVDVSSGEKKWEITGSFPGGVAGLSFTNKGRSLHVVGTNGMVSEMNSETGTPIQEFKASKKQISALAFSSDENFLAVADDKLCVLSLEDGKKLLKFSNETGHVQFASISDDASALVTSGSRDKHLQVWSLDKNSGTVSRGSVLSMKHTPLSFQCKDGCNGKSSTVVLAVSKSGVAYVWHLNSLLEEEVNPIKVTCKVNEDEKALQNSESVKNGRVSIFAARLQSLDATKDMKALIAFGSIDHPQFSLVDISKSGQDVVINASDETTSILEDGVAKADLQPEATVSPKKNKKTNKKRLASEADQSTVGDMVDIGPGEAADGVLVDDDINEPTMGEKLAGLNLVENNTAKSNENDESSVIKPPSADSVHVLLKQALHADDRAILLDCLYTQDEKVIAKSISLLNPSDVLKLLQSLISITQSRGAVLVCALPWLRSLLLHHASEIISQESSLLALNSLYQLIESRVSTLQSALKVSSVLEVLYTGNADEDQDETEMNVPIIYEDRDESEESEDAMETDDENSDDADTDNDEEAPEGAFGDLSDLEGMSE